MTHDHDHHHHHEHGHHHSHAPATFSRAFDGVHVRGDDGGRGRVS